MATPNPSDTPPYGAPIPWDGRRESVKSFVAWVARTDPIRAWQIWSEYQSKSRLDDIALLIGIGTVAVLIAVVVLFRGFFL